MGVGSVVGGVVRGGVDWVTYPVSMGVESLTGKSIGDFVSGNQRPPSKNGFVGGAVSFATNVIAPGVIAMIPGVGIPLATGYTVVNVGSKAVSGNSFGDYVTGNSDTRRQEAENARVDAEHAAAHQRMESRERSQAIAMQPQVEAQSIGQQQAQMQGQMR